MVAFSLSNKGLDANRSHSGMIPMLDIAERQIRPAHSLSGSTTASIADQPEDDENSFKARSRRYWLSDIDRDWTDILLIICGYISGLVEGLSFNYWGSFSNMQTGIFPTTSAPSKLSETRAKTNVSNRKYNSACPWRIRQTRQPGLFMGKSPNRRRCIPPRQLLLRLLLTTPRPPPTRDHNPLLCCTNYPPSRRSGSRPNRSRQPKPRQRPDEMDKRYSNRTDVLPSCRTDYRLQVSSLYGDPDSRPDCLDVWFVYWWEALPAAVELQPEAEQEDWVRDRALCWCVDGWWYGQGAGVG